MFSVLYFRTQRERKEESPLNSARASSHKQAISSPSLSLFLLWRGILSHYASSETHGGKPSFVEPEKTGIYRDDGKQRSIIHYYCNGIMSMHFSIFLRCHSVYYFFSLLSIPLHLPQSELLSSIRTGLLRDSFFFFFFSSSSLL